jgi:hypothetical protein
MHVDGDLARDGHVSLGSGWPERALPRPVGRHERHAAAVAA